MRQHRRVPALLLLLSTPFLQGCGAPLTVATLAPHQPLPAEVWACPAQPEPPQGDSFDDATLASWVADLAASGQGCRDQLATAHDIVEGK